MYIAEMSGNHLGSLDRAMAIVQTAADSGADAIKLQTFTPEQMAEPDAIVKSGPWAGLNLVELYRKTHVPREWHKPLFDKAKSCGIIAFSSVFHKDDVDFLETLDCPIYKISSFEITDLDLIQYAASTNKLIIISTGMATFEEIRAAFEASGKKAILLQCTSAYPAKLEEANIWSMSNLQREFACVVGLSDHTLGHTCAMTAQALGALVIEKHFTLSRADGGPDAAFSAEPHEFAAMVKACNEVKACLGEVRYGPKPSEATSLQMRRKPGGKRGA